MQIEGRDTAQPDPIEAAATDDGGHASPPGSTGTVGRGAGDRKRPAQQLTGAWIVALWFGMYEVAVGIVVATRPNDTIFSSIEGALQLALLFSAPAVWLAMDRLVIALPGTVERLLGWAQRRLPARLRLAQSLHQRVDEARQSSAMRAARRRRGGWRLLFGARTAWDRIAAQRSLGDQLVDVGVRIAVSSAVVVLAVVAAAATPSSSSPARGVGLSVATLVVLLLLGPVVIILVRWWISVATGLLTLIAVVGMLGVIDFDGLQQQWNEDHDERIVEFVVLEAERESSSSISATLTMPVQALRDQPGAEAIFMICKEEQARALGASIRVAWSTGEIADLASDGLWRVRDVVVITSPEEATLQQRLNAMCEAD